MTIALVKVRRTHKIQLGTSREHQPIEGEITVRSKPNEPKERLALSKLPIGRTQSGEEGALRISLATLPLKSPRSTLIASQDQPSKEGCLRYK